MTALILGALAVYLATSALIVAYWAVFLAPYDGGMDGFDLTDDDAPRDDGDCGWWVGPVWKAGGAQCVCIEPRGHRLPHRCSCGAWFEECGHPPWEFSGDFDDDDAPSDDSDYAPDPRTTRRRINGDH